MIHLFRWEIALWSVTSYLTSLGLSRLVSQRLVTIGETDVGLASRAEKLCRACRGGAEKDVPSRRLQD